MEADWQTVGEKRRGTNAQTPQSSGQTRYVPPALRAKQEPTYDSMFGRSLGTFQQVQTVKPPSAQTTSPSTTPLILSLIKAQVAKDESERLADIARAKAIAEERPINDYEEESLYIAKTGITRRCASIPARAQARAEAQRLRAETEAYYGSLLNIPSYEDFVCEEQEPDYDDFSEQYSDTHVDDEEESDYDDGPHVSDKFGWY
jgi:hypothetical protein